MLPTNSQKSYIAKVKLCAINYAKKHGNLNINYIHRAHAW